MSQIELRVDGVVVYSSGGEPLPVPPAPPPVVPPASPLPPATPVPGRMVLQRPLTRGSGLPGGYPMGVPLDMTVFNPYVFSCPANTIHAHPLRFDSSVYTKNGAVLSFNQFVVNTNRRDVWISEAPGSAARVDAGNFGSQALSNSENSNLNIRFDRSEFGKAFLQKDRDYWLNVMPTNLNEPMDYFIVFNPSAQ